jgi:hypothetical protein
VVEIVGKAHHRRFVENERARAEEVETVDHYERRAGVVDDQVAQGSRHAPENVVAAFARVSCDEERLLDREDAVSVGRAVAGMLRLLAQQPLARAPTRR